MDNVLIQVRKDEYSLKKDEDEVWIVVGNVALYIHRELNSKGNEIGVEVEAFADGCEDVDPMTMLFADYLNAAKIILRRRIEDREGEENA